MKLTERLRELIHGKKKVIPFVHLKGVKDEKKISNPDSNKQLTDALYNRINK